MIRKAPTYLLDEEYYFQVDRLAIVIECKMNQVFANTIGNYMQYLESHNIEELRTHSEYGLELLYIGVLHQAYKQEGDSLYIKLKRLYEWLESTKEFDGICERFRLWLTYWVEEEHFIPDITVVLDLTKEFLEICESNLSHYTVPVIEFQEKAKRVYKDRNDFIFVMRHIYEYYMNMVGAQILNRVYREEFLRANQVFIFVPGCMSMQLDQCKAIKSKMGYTCSKCTDSCPIYQVSQISDKQNAKTVIVYHNSDLYHTKLSTKENRNGVIGIACVLNLISGGLKAKELGYVPQCVLLNYCGCKQHWDFEGLVTDINRNRLEEILYRGENVTR